MTENNKTKKSDSRRYVICISIMSLATAAFVYCVERGIAHNVLDTMLKFFNIYVLILFGTGGVAMGVMTFTSIFGKLGK